MMQDQTGVTPHRLGDLAGRITQEHRLCQEAALAAVQHAMAGGDLLIEAKALCPHGAWQDWLAEHCTLSERSAQLYMRLARNRPAIEEQAQRVAGLSVRQAAALLTAPRTAPVADEPPRFNLEAALAAIRARHQSHIAAIKTATSVEDLTAIVHIAADLQNQAAEYRLRAERAIGTIINDTPPHFRPALLAMMAEPLSPDEQAALAWDEATLALVGSVEAGLAAIDARLGLA